MADSLARNDDFDADVEKMLNSVPWANVPATNTLPEQLYNFEIVDVYGGLTQANPNESKLAKAKVVVTMVIHAPDDFNSRFHTENFIVGTDRDPLAQKPETWLSGGSFAATNLKKLMDFTASTTWLALKDKKFAAFTRNSGTDGREYSNILHNQYYHWNTMPAGTATPPNPGRRGRMSGRTANAASSSGPATSVNVTMIPCPTCEQPFTPDVMLTHLKNCNGLPAAALPTV